MRSKSIPLRLEELEPRTALSVFYVATTGNDTGNGSSQTPWATLQHAVDAIHPGDTIMVESGTYVGCRIGNSGTANAPCTLEAAPGATVIVNAPGPSNQHNSDIEVENFNGTVSYWIINGLTAINGPRSGIDIRVTTNITVENCIVHNSGRTGIFLAFSDNPLIEYNQSYSNGEHGIYNSNSSDNATILGNTLHDNANCGVHMNGDLSQGGDGLITGALVEDNVIYNNGATGGSGINCDGVQNSIIENNLLYNNHASGISLYKTDGAAGSMNDIVVNNTIVMASNARWALNIQSGSTNDTAYNNILLNNNPSHGSISISPDSLPGFVSNYNVLTPKFTEDGGNTSFGLAQWQSSTGQDKNSFYASASSLFVNAAANNYQLSSTSPVIDKGTATDAPKVDILGKPRPSGKGYDIGAYEYQSTTRYGATSSATPTASLGSLLSTSPAAGSATSSAQGTALGNLSGYVPATPNNLTDALDAATVDWLFSHHDKHL